MAGCLTEAGPEGAPATWSFSRVLWQGPWHTLMLLRREALRIAPNTKQIQLLETGLTLALLVGFAGLYWATGSLVGLAYWGVAFSMSATMPIWASYIPHHVSSRNPAARTAAALAQAWTPITASFAFHHLHHHYPRVPTSAPRPSCHLRPRRSITPKSGGWGDYFLLITLLIQSLLQSPHYAAQVLVRHGRAAGQAQAAGKQIGAHRSAVHGRFGKKRL